MKGFFKYYLLLTIIVFNIFSAPLVLAISNPFDPTKGDPPVLQVDVGQSFSSIKEISCSGGDNCLSVSWIGEYVKAIYKYGVGLAVILAIVMIMVGGFIWLLSAGSPDKVKTAKNFISSSLTGLVLALFSFIILQAVNPNLVDLKPLQITVPKEISLTPVAPVTTSSVDFSSWVLQSQLPEELSNSIIVNGNRGSFQRYLSSLESTSGHRITVDPDSFLIYSDTPYSGDVFVSEDSGILTPEFYFRINEGINSPNESAFLANNLGNLVSTENFSGSSSSLENELASRQAVYEYNVRGYESIVAWNDAGYWDVFFVN